MLLLILIIGGESSYSLLDSVLFTVTLNFKESMAKIILRFVWFFVFVFFLCKYRLVPQSVWVALTKDHRLAAETTSIYFLWFWRLEKPETKVPAEAALGELRALFLGWWTRRAEGEPAALWAPFQGSPTLGTSSNPRHPGG